MDRCPSCGFFLRSSGPRTERQLGYYRGCILPCFSEYTGYEIDEMHQQLLDRCGLVSTATAESAEFASFIDRVLRLANRMEIPIPPPGVYEAFIEMPLPDNGAKHESG